MSRAPVTAPAGVSLIHKVGSTWAHPPPPAAQDLSASRERRGRRGNAYKNGFLLCFEGCQLGLTLLLGQDSSCFFNALEILLANNEGCCWVLRRDAGHRERVVSGMESPTAPSVPCPTDLPAWPWDLPGLPTPGVAGAAPRPGVTREQCRKRLSCGDPSLPVGGEEETESAVKAAPCCDARGTGCSAGWPGASRENLKMFSMGLVSPNKKMLKVFQSNLTFPALIGENFDHCPDPFSSGTCCSSLPLD